MALDIERKLIDRNYSEGRSGHKIKFIVLHTMNGISDLDGDLSGWFNSPKAKSSAHYSIGFNGTQIQYVKDIDTAWHAGEWIANCKSIGIEFADMGKPMNAERTDVLYGKGAQLIAHLIMKHDLGTRAILKRNIRLHKYFTNTGCPGRLDYERLIRLTNGILRKRFPANKPAPHPTGKGSEASM